MVVDLETVRTLLVGIEVAVILFFIVANSFYGIQLVLALIEVRRHGLASRGEDHARLLSTHGLPRITVLAPAYNEATTIEESAHALLGLYYPELELIIIDDGSKDDTMKVLDAAFHLEPVTPVAEAALATAPIIASFRSATHPNLLVVQKENGGKPDALNAGLNHATGDLVCAIDADTLIEPDALLRMVRPFVRDPEVMAAGGTVRIANTSLVRAGRITEARVPHRPIPGYQVIEYLRAFLFGRMGLNRLGGNIVISGAFGLFRRRAVVAVGGYAHGSVGEDLELVLRMRRRGYEQDRPHKVVFIPDPVAWTEAPDNLRVLGRQRDRWHRGLAQSMWMHKRMVLNPRYKATGTVVLPYFVFIELLAPVVEVIGLIGILLGLGLGAFDWTFALAFFLFAYGYGIFLTAMTVLLDEMAFRRFRRVKDKLWLVLWVVTENFGYRQITVYWRLRGLIKAVLRKGTWGEMERSGFQKDVVSPKG